MKTMHRWLVPATAAMLVMAPAFAQSGGGDVDPAQSRAAQGKRTTPQERAEARQERRIDGREAARKVVPGDAEAPMTTAERGARANAGPRKHFETAKERRAAEREQKSMGAPARRSPPVQPVN